jgi:pimeloyl-ACP methyl ester carboxylesterase
MYYEIIGEGEPLVLISGLGGDHLNWAMAQVPAFTGAGYQCLVFDNRDVGQTDDSPAASYTIRQFADDTAALLDQLDLGPAHVLGTSMGGMIAQELTINYPERVRSATFVCTFAAAEPYIVHLFESWKTVARHVSLSELYAVIGPWVFTHRFYEQPENVQMFMQMLQENPFPQSADCFCRQCDAIVTHDALDRLKSITAPTHVIVGGEDILTPPRQSRALADQIPEAELTVVPEAGHGLSWEKPLEFNQAVLEFLKAV